MNPRWIRVAAIVAGVAVVAAIVLMVRGRHAPVRAAAPDTAPAVATARAAFGPFVVRVRAGGRIGAPAGSEAKLSFAASGLISAIHVKVGERVQAGQMLAQLDTRGLAIDAATARADAAAAAASYGGGSVPNQALASARARLAAAEAKLNASHSGNAGANSDASAAATALRQSEEKVLADQRSLDRAQQLYAAGVSALKDVEAAREQLRLDQGDVTANRAKASAATASIGGAKTQAQADYEQALTDVKNAEAQVAVTGAQAASARDKAAQAQRALESATLRAPDSGVVMSILKHVGESVDPTQPAIVVGPPSDRVVTLAVSGTDAGVVRVGQRVTVSDPTRGSQGAGRVVGVVPSVDPATQSTTVVVSAVPPDGAPGDAVNATIDVATDRGIIVPATAVVADPQSGKQLVFVRAPDKNGEQKFSPREVNVGPSDDAHTLIRSGLRNGDVVAGQGAFDLLAPAGGG